jgi:hypothetical protein
LSADTDADAWPSRMNTVFSIRSTSLGFMGTCLSTR